MEYSPSLSEFAKLLLPFVVIGGLVILWRKPSLRQILTVGGAIIGGFLALSFVAWGFAASGHANLFAALLWIIVLAGSGLLAWKYFRPKPVPPPAPSSPPDLREARWTREEELKERGISDEQ
jgi:hypothetical protein